MDMKENLLLLEFARREQLLTESFEYYNSLKVTEVN